MVIPPDYYPAVGGVSRTHLTDYATCQSSKSRPGTWLNSWVLFVTRMKPCAKAMAAMMRSFGPIGIPMAARCARVLPYSSAKQMAHDSGARDSYSP